MATWITGAVGITGVTGKEGLTVLFKGICVGEEDVGGGL